MKNFFLNDSIVPALLGFIVGWSIVRVAFGNNVAIYLFAIIIATALSVLRLILKSKQ